MTAQAQLNAAVRSSDDPIFPLIEAHKQSLLERERACDAVTHGTVVEDDDVIDPLFFREVECLRAVIRTEPTTIAGLRAMVAYLADYAAAYQLPDTEDDDNGPALKILGTLNRSLSNIAAA
jgi:hypothetical protein